MVRDSVLARTFQQPFLECNRGWQLVHALFIRALLSCSLQVFAQNKTLIQAHTSSALLFLYFFLYLFIYFHLFFILFIYLSIYLLIYLFFFFFIFFLWLKNQAKFCFQCKVSVLQVHGAMCAPKSNFCSMNTDYFKK